MTSNKKLFNCKAVDCIDKYNFENFNLNLHNPGTYSTIFWDSK